MTDRRALLHDDVEAVHALLICVCRGEAGCDLAAETLAPLADLEFRQRFLEFSTRHGLLGMSLAVLAADPAVRGAAYRHELDRMLESQRQRAAVLEMRRDVVLKVLRRGGLDPVVLKGAAMVGREYEDPVERDLVDLDLLFTREQTVRAVDLLQREGYRPPEPRSRLDAYRRHHFHIPMHHRDSHCVELHWDLSMPGSPFRLNPEKVLEEARRLELQDRPVILVPRAEHRILHGVLQNLQEGFSRLARAVDIDRILMLKPSLDWDELVLEARRGKLGPATALTLQLAKRLLDTPIPEATIRRLSPSPLPRIHLALMDPPSFLLGQRSLRVTAAKDLAEFWLADGPGARVEFLLGLRHQGFRSGRTADRSDVRHGIGRLLKLVGLQCWLYWQALAIAPRNP